MKEIEEVEEFDVVIRIPPKRRYTIEVEVKSIKRAEPRITHPHPFEIVRISQPRREAHVSRRERANVYE